MAITLEQDILSPSLLQLDAVENATEEITCLLMESERSYTEPQPLTAGIPFPPGRLRTPTTLALVSPTGAVLPVQTEVLARWPDDSVKWLLLDVVADRISAGPTTWRLESLTGTDSLLQNAILCWETRTGVVVETGTTNFFLDKSAGTLLGRVFRAGQDMLSREGLYLRLTDARGGVCKPIVKETTVQRGPIRTTVCVTGEFRGRAPCRYAAELSFYAGTGLVRLNLTLHNPRRACHRGGLWDLGDAGSILLRELTLQLGPAAAFSGIEWLAEPGQSGCSDAQRRPKPGAASGPLFEIYQDSSGGANWPSRNHVDRQGRVPCSFRGYRVRHGAEETQGLRANPVVALHGPFGTVAAAIAEFWQQFPKAIEVDEGQLKLGLFPRQFASLHELQGGEQKTHTVWLNFSSEQWPADESSLASALPSTTGHLSSGHWPLTTYHLSSGHWPLATDHLSFVHQPSRLKATSAWYAASGAMRYFSPGEPTADSPFATLTAQAVEGHNSLQARREIIDEYGWRNYGDLYADHEGAHYAGPAPVVSHYNNQYDMLLGALWQYLNTNDRRWWAIADPLARHVIDIDIYHTDRDKAAYNGGLFWHTDHYRDAATATHRSYARANQIAGHPYGGGPCDEHNYTTGLLCYYYLTGSSQARLAVLGLADWVLAMDDGNGTVFGLIDDGPTGAASGTVSADYHGPGRGCGNSINALLDGWLLSQNDRYLRKAEELIHRSIHPRDDIAGRDLLDVERRWSYTVFLTALARYLDLKAVHHQLDASYAYAQASLLHYASWMADHERPYFDRPEKLEFPTETWAAQELRKANVLRLAAVHADEPLRSRLLKRGDEFAKRAWADLFRFPHPGTTRALAILLIEGPKDASLSLHEAPDSPRAPRSTLHDFGMPEHFVPQRQRVMTALRSFTGLTTCGLRLADPRRWWTVWSRRWCAKLPKS